MKWRVPANDKEFAKQGDLLNYEELPIKITLDGMDIKDRKDAMNHLVNSELFKESKRFIFPMMPYFDEKQVKELIEKSYVNTNDNITSIIGDVPFIEQTPLNRIELGNFIFPLNNSDTFIFNRSGKGRLLSGLFYINKDLAILHSANKFVAFRDIMHLENVIKLYDQIVAEGREKDILDFMFNFT